MLFTSREEFYSALWEDYRSYIKTAAAKTRCADRSSESDISGCFYYRFIKRKKDAAAEEISFSRELIREYAEKPKRDKYILLHGAYLAFRSGNITEEEYKDIFTDIIGSSKKNGRKFLQLLERNAADANGQLEYLLLRGCVGDFFDNEGFRASGEGFDLTPRHRKEKQGYNDIIEMLYFYMREKNISGETAVKTSEISDEYIEKCSALYGAALREKRENAFIPLYFDNDSGAGIFIVGKGLFEDKNEIGGDCAVCIIYFYDFSAKEPILGDEIDLLMNVVPHNTVIEAFSNFSDSVYSHEYFKNYAEMNYRYNDRFCPEGTDEIFIPRLVPKGEMLRRPVKPTNKERRIMENGEAEEERNIASLRGKNL